MKAPVLIAVDRPAEEFASLFAAAKAAAVRIGWLAMNAPADPPPPLQAPPLLEAFRAVAVGDGRTIAMKPMKGKAVLRDLLREHFLGADVVLVAGLELFPRLTPRGEGPWNLAESATASRHYTTEELLVRLRKPALRWKTP
ncbi:MAG: hypothetical protein ABI689_19315 [Thermoanaerobaculia bacterium]